MEVDIKHNKHMHKNKRSRSRSRSRNNLIRNEPEEHVQDCPPSHRNRQRGTTANSRNRGSHDGASSDRREGGRERGLMCDIKNTIDADDTEFRKMPWANLSRSHLKQYNPRETLLGRLNGTVLLLPRVRWLIFTTVVMSYVACLVYDPIRHKMKIKDDPRRPAVFPDQATRMIYYLFFDAEKMLFYLTSFVTFILGFFNSVAYNRWWKLRTLVGDIAGRTQDTALMIVSYISHGGNDPNVGDNQRQIQKQLLRYLNLAHALTLQKAQNVRDEEWLINQGLMERGSKEHRAITTILDSGGTGAPEVYCWFQKRLFFCIQSGFVGKLDKHGGQICMLIQENISKIRGWSGDVGMFLSCQIPLAYTHLLEVIVTIYVLVLPVALVPTFMWVAPPLAGVVTLFFYGFFRLGTDVMLNPFHHTWGFDNFGFFEATRQRMQSMLDHAGMSDDHFSGDMVTESS